MDDILKSTANDYSKYLNIDVKNQLDPFSKTLDDLLSRLEEFQTIININKQEQVHAKEQLSDILKNKEQLLQLFERIDKIEDVMAHIRHNLDIVEEQITRAEDKYGLTDSKTNKVANIFTPLFKKVSNERKDNNVEYSGTFKTEDYFS